MYSDYERHSRRRPIADRSMRIFWNTAVLCGTVIVIAVTVKVVMSIFF